MSAKQRIGLVIGSGALKCVAALGLFKVLEREGIGIDPAVGCSGSSIYTSLLALNHSVKVYDFCHISYIIQEGQRAAERELPYLKTLLKA